MAAGLLAVAPQLVAGDHTSAAPAVAEHQVVVAAAPGDDVDTDLAVDLNNWQEARISFPASASKFKPFLQPKFTPGRATGRPRRR